MQIRRLWGYYFQNTEGLIFVVDCADQDRIEEARRELQRLLAAVLIPPLPVLHHLLLSARRLTGDCDLMIKAFDCVLGKAKLSGLMTGL